MPRKNWDLALFPPLRAANTVTLQWRDNRVEHLETSGETVGVCAWLFKHMEPVASWRRSRNNSLRMKLSSSYLLAPCSLSILVVLYAMLTSNQSMSCPTVRPPGLFITKFFRLFWIAKRCSEFVHHNRRATGFWHDLVLYAIENAPALFHYCGVQWRSANCSRTKKNQHMYPWRVLEWKRILEKSNCRRVDIPATALFRKLIWKTATKMDAHLWDNCRRSRAL